VIDTCHICGIPADAGYFDESSIRCAPDVVGQEVLLARYELHRNHCGVLMYFAQFTDAYAADPTQVATPELEWQIRCSGVPRDPYLTFKRIVNPWGLSGFPIGLRLDEAAVVEFVVRGVELSGDGPEGRGVCPRVNGDDGLTLNTTSEPRVESETTILIPNVDASGRGGTPAKRSQLVGGRILGRHWYNDMYGGTPQRP